MEACFYGVSPSVSTDCEDHESIKVIKLQVYKNAGVQKWIKLARKGPQKKSSQKQYLDQSLIPLQC